MKKYLPRAILYPNRKKDREILAWLEKIPAGFKTQTIKDAIWANISGVSPAPTSWLAESPPPTYETQAARNGMMRASLSLDTRELLADIRQIVEAGVAQGLANHGTATQEKPPNLENEIEAMLDHLDMSFMLDDDDENDEDE